MVKRLATLILPSALRDAGNQLAVALGHDDADPPDTYNVPLVPIGETEPTHYGTSTPVTEGFEAMILAAQQGSYDGLPAEIVPLAQSVIAGLLADFTSIDAIPGEHFDSVAAAQGLERYVAPDL